MPSRLVASFALLLQTPPAAPAPTLKYDMPEGWTTKPLSSKMRVAEFVLPKAEGDSRTPRNASIQAFLKSLHAE